MNQKIHTKDHLDTCIVQFEVQMGTHIVYALYSAVTNKIVVKIEPTNGEAFLLENGAEFASEAAALRAVGQYFTHTEKAFILNPPNTDVAPTSIPPEVLNQLNQSGAAKESRKGDCYRLAFEFAKKNPAYNVVHGIPLGQAGVAKGLRYGHAWCEIGCAVYDPVADVFVEKHAYYAAGQIEYAISYTYKQAVAETARWEHYGPWDATVSQAVHKDDK